MRIILLLAFVCSAQLCLGRAIEDLKARNPKPNVRITQGLLNTLFGNGSLFFGDKESSRPSKRPQKVQYYPIHVDIPIPPAPPQYSHYPPYFPPHPPYPSYPQYPSHPSPPHYPGHHGYPSFPSYPSHQSYPSHHSYPSYPNYPSPPIYKPSYGHGQGIEIHYPGMYPSYPGHSSEEYDP